MILPNDEYTILREGSEFRFQVHEVDGLLDDIEDECDEARSMSYDEGKAHGFIDGLQEQEEMDDNRRQEEMRLSLYRAIYAGDMEEAENIANLMGMVGIDRDIVWQARQEVRLHV